MQAVNPYLPADEYIPDGEPYVFGNRVYIYGSHDEFNGSAACMNDYVCWSAPVDDLGNWQFEGTIYRKDQDPDYRPGQYLYAPDVAVGPDGLYYLYYSLSMTGTLSVARSASPAGPFDFYGQVSDADGNILGQADDDVFQFDPAVFRDDDGRVWLYSGFGYCRENKVQRFGNRLTDGGYCFELESDMKTAKSQPTLLLPKKTLAAGTGFEGHAYFEASSMRKINGLYYLVYSSEVSHELCYAVSQFPDKDFRFGGVLISNCDIGMDFLPDSKALNHWGNNHGGMVKIRDRWYIFYHRQTNNHGNSRQGCAEPIQIEKDGNIRQVEMTSCGLNREPLSGSGTYSAGIACHLFSECGDYPYITQEEDVQYVTNLKSGGVVGYKYFDLTNTHSLSVTVRGAGGTFRIFDGINGSLMAEVSFPESLEYGTYSCSLSKSCSRNALYFRAETDGSMDFKAFTLQ